MDFDNGLVGRLSDRKRLDLEVGARNSLKDLCWVLVISIFSFLWGHSRGLPREKKEIERKPSTDFEILLMSDG
jgi:hypothetical protein